MPELAEVEFARYQFEEYGLESEIISIKTRNESNEFDTIVCNECDENELRDVLKKGNKIVKANRHGKQLYFDIVAGNGKNKVKSLLVHFGMTGSLVWKDKVIPDYKSFNIDKEWPPRFAKLEISFKNGNIVAYCDPRRLGRIKLRSDPMDEEPLSKLAPDPSIDGIGDRNKIAQKMSTITSSIKAVLLDQEKLFSGLGNWMADEVLYQSSIHPESVTKKITGQNLTSLLDSIKYVSDTAVACCLSGKQFPSSWLFHHRWDRKLTQLPTGEAIKTIKVGGRTSAYVPSIQKLCTTNGKDDDVKNETKRKKKTEKNDDDDNMKNETIKKRKSEKSNDAHDIDLKKKRTRK
jgi:DNA-formamidopyrimidine glycosylase